MPEIVGRLRPPRLASAPASPAYGEMYYDTGANILYWWNGTAWVSGSGGTASEVFTGPNTPPGSQVLWIDTDEPAASSDLDYNHPLIQPPGVFVQNVARQAATSTASAQTGILRLMGMVVPAGRQITKVTVAPTSAPSSPINQWACLVRPSDMAVLSKSTDQGTALTTQGQPFVYTGLNYTPANDEFIYVGVVYNGSSQWYCAVAYSGSTASPGPAVTIPPILVGNSTTGLTNPASLGANAAAISFYNQMYWVGVGS